MSSDPTRQTLPSNENPSHMEVDPQVAQQPPEHTYTEDDLLDDEEEENNMDLAPSNSAGAQPDTASVTEADTIAMEGTSDDFAADQAMDQLSSDLHRVTTSEMAGQPSGLRSEFASPRRRQTTANELHFSRAMESMARSNANAGVLPGSSNRFSALAEPVQASRSLDYRQAKELADKLLADRSKRLRSPSTDSPRPHKSARTESEDVDMRETAPEPFNFREIVDPKSSSQCFIKADDGDWFGATHGKLPNYQVNVQILGGRLGLPLIKICFSICKKQFFNKAIDKTNAADAFHELVCIWQPGLILDPTDPQYQLSDFEVSHQYSINDKVDMPEALAKNTTDILTRTVGVSFKSQTVTLEGSDRATVNHMDSALLNTLDHVRLRPCKVTVWYVAPGGIEKHVQNTLKHFQKALENHLPPLHQYLIPPTWELNTDINLPPIRHFQGGMYCKYPEKNKVEDVTQAPKSFWTLPTKLHFQSVMEFQIYYSVGLIREYQWQRGRTAHMSQRPHRIFLLKTFGPRSNRSESQPKLSKVQAEFRSSYYGYVTMAPNEQGLQESAPPEGTMFTLDWANKAGDKGTHLFSPRHEQWFGKVCAADSNTLSQLGAHFCLILKKPLGVEGQKSYYQPIRVKRLPKAYLIPMFNSNPATREVNAVHQFCNSSRDDLRLLRLAAVADPRHGIVETTDIRTGPDGQTENIAKYSASLDARRDHFNGGQIKVLESVGSVVNKLILVQGPPGSGKTLTTSHLVDLLTEVGHKVLITCPSNGAVDENAKKLWTVQPKGKKILRLEITTIDKANTLARKKEDYNHPEMSLPSLESHADDWQDDPIYTDMLAQLATAEIVVGQESADADKLVEGFQNLKKDYATVYDRTQKKHDFPRGMSMAYRIWEMVQADVKAANDFELEDTGMNRAIARSEGTHRAPDDPSMRYRHLIDQYNALEGQLSKEERAELQYEYEMQVARVIRDTDILLATCNNSGSDVVRDNFKPSMLIIDEAGQATLPAALVPMTAYSDWMACMLIGDQQQLQPMVTSKEVNEFEGNLKISLFSLVIMKGFITLLLNLQYRMCPEISSFPSRFFYDGKLLDAKSVTLDHPVRKMVRNVSFQYFNINGPNGNGNEYWMIDVARGVSRREENGTSLQNYANATVVIDVMRKLVKEGVPKSVIRVLSFYKGQMRTIVNSAEGVPELDDIEGIATVDSYQGQEAQVVILDLVVAHNNITRQTEGLDNVYDLATQHVRNPNRLCVALTRAHYGLIVIANVRAMGKGNKVSDGGRTLASMLVDSKERGLLYIDKETRDTHPIAVEKMEKNREYRKQVAAEMDMNEHLSFIDDIVRKKHNLGKKNVPVANQRPITYRSGTKKPTTLPHIDKDLKAKMPALANTSKPNWVGKGKQPRYNKDLIWEQPSHGSEPKTHQEPSKVSEGKESEESSEVIESMDYGESPKEVREPKEPQEPPMASGSNQASDGTKPPPSNSQPPMQQGQQPTRPSTPEWIKQRENKARRGEKDGGWKGWRGGGKPRGRR